MLVYMVFREYFDGNRAMRGIGIYLGKMGHQVGIFQFQLINFPIEEIILLLSIR